MRRVVRSTWLAAAIFAAAVPMSQASADEAQTPAWQQVISSQIEAFRDKDAVAAFSYAVAKFQADFPSAQAFFDAIVGEGYAPIMESRSHSFGAFQMVGDSSVLQEVTLMGTDQGLYQAIYQLDDEPNGWRVEGVVLQKAQGVGI